MCGMVGGCTYAVVMDARESWHDVDTARTKHNVDARESWHNGRSLDNKYTKNLI